MERLRGFYALQPEQAPDPGRLRHDACLLARYLRGGGPPASLLVHRARWLVGGGADGADTGAGDVEAPEAGLPLADEAEEEDAEGTRPPEYLPQLGERGHHNIHKGRSTTTTANHGWSI